MFIIKRSVLIAAAILIFSGVGLVFCADDQANLSEGSLYSYNKNDIPEIFFFPKEKARWDGSKVTLREWYMLTDLQKEKFISEYVHEMAKQYSGPVNIVFGDYVNALNLFSYYSNDNLSGEPSTHIIDELLRQQGKAASSAQGAKDDMRKDADKIQEGRI